MEKSDNLDDEYMSIPVTKINEVNAIGRGVKNYIRLIIIPFLLLVQEQEPHAFIMLMESLIT